MAVWDDDLGINEQPPEWLLTGHMLLWSDGSPAHIDMERFAAVDGGWVAPLMISRSTLSGTRWLTMRIKLTRELRREWETQRTSARVPRCRRSQFICG